MIKSDLSAHIQSTVLIDTHEHLCSEADMTQGGPDILQDLFNWYTTADLKTAGASQVAIERLTDKKNPDLRARFNGIKDAWERTKHTGYGEATRLVAQHVYGIMEITAEAIETAAPKVAELNKSGERKRILKEIGNIDHVQIDNFCWPCLPDPGGVDFFLYDLSWMGFTCGDANLAELHTETGVQVKDLPTLREGMAALFAKYGPQAIAVKSQAAYQRTLLWQERSEADVARALNKTVNGLDLSGEEKLCLGDWCWARGAELAAQYNLPFKIHTGYLAGNGNMVIDPVRAAYLSELIRRYPQTRFVLMHTAYPYGGELAAMAKHYANVYVDLCWAWSIDPHSTTDFVHRMIHTVPAHKLFLFGGDTYWPNAAVAFAIQARVGLTRALQSEIDQGQLTEREAIALATRFMQGNQRECFDIEGVRSRLTTAG